jgi:N-acetylglucosamine kinase-like BadF-type ATPase
MILIADSGSTKTDWAAVEEGKIISRIQTKGMNPFFQTEEEMTKELENVLLPQLEQKLVTSAYFYGAGCTVEKSPIVAEVLRRTLKITQNVEVHSDMLGAARGLCGRDHGIVCILGTGSNSCLYDGQGLIANVSPLGFILGDEGSGAVLGKLLVGDLLKNQLGEDLKEKFLKQYNLTPAEIIDRVYRKPFPNRFLASLSPFIAENIHIPAIRKLVKDSFLAFLRRNVMQYDKHQIYKVNFIGSIAYYYKEILTEAVEECALHMGKIMRAPMEGLIEYHN